MSRVITKRRGHGCRTKRKNLVIPSFVKKSVRIIYTNSVKVLKCL